MRPLALGFALSNREQSRMKKMLYDAQVLANKLPEARGRPNALDIARSCKHMELWVKTVLGSHFGVFGEFTAHFRTYFSGGWDVHWGYDLDLDPWPYGCGSKKCTKMTPW